jgi:hypothetical protein
MYSIYIINTYIVMHFNLFIIPMFLLLYYFRKKVWQGQAFETNEGSMNSPQPSPTSCLKIRHMFGPDS